MALVAGYGSDTDASEGSGNEPIARREREEIQSDGSDSNSLCSESDGAEDGGEDAHRDDEGPDASGLPSALDAWEDVEGRPAFLDPEATRQLAAHPTHGVADAATEQEAEDAAGAAGGRQKPSADFDISKLAPPLKGQKRQGAVIEGKAKRYRPEEGPEAQQQYTAAQIAMLGGQLREADATESTPGERGSASAPQGKASKAMPVSEFLDKGIGGAALPRRKQDRKEKEKSKRALGQSSVHGWKTEAEMVLRQQYDS